MLPSRGLRWSGQAIGIGRRRINLSSARNFSSTRSIRASPLLPGKSAPFLTANTRLASSTTTKSILIRNGAGIRFASTTPAAPGIAVSKAPISTATPTPTDTVASSVGSAPTTSFDTAFDSASEFVHESMLDVPEHIGYLKSLGLDYGWGPTGLMEWTLEHVHVLAGTPWWVSITLTALLVRGVLFYPYISAAENGARMSATAHLTRPIMEKSKEAMLAGDEAASQQLRAELLRINKRAGIAYWKSMVPMLQIIPGMGTFFLLKAMANLPVPGLETGGALWFNNLAIPDPYFLLPVMTATVLHWVLRKGGEMGTSPMEPKMMKALMWGMPTLTLLFTWWLPAAVQLSFFVSGVLSYLQSALLRQTWFRSLFDMTPVVPKINTISAAPVSPYQGIMKRAAPSGPLSSTELGSRFEGPKGGLHKTVGHINTLQPPSAIKTILGAPIKGIKEAVGSIKDAGKSTFESAKGAMDKRSQKSAVADRKAYEKKRQTQLKREEREKSSELRAQRAARRALGQKEQ